jgi:hypothetical protein
MTVTFVIAVPDASRPSHAVNSTTQINSNID